MLPGVLLEQVHGFDTERYGELGKRPQRDARFAGLDLLPVSPMHSRVVGNRFEREPLSKSPRTHVRCETSTQLELFLCPARHTRSLRNWAACHHAKFGVDLSKLSSEKVHAALTEVSDETWKTCLV